jgi:hypothetical protein
MVLLLFGIRHFHRFLNNDFDPHHLRARRPVVTVRCQEQLLEAVFLLPYPLVGEGLGMRGISLRESGIPLTPALSYQGRGR